jgi:hypothetical protein
MDQILPLVETLLARIDWISAGLTGCCVLAVSGFATLFVRGFELEGARYTIVWFVIFAVSIWPARIGARTYVAPPIYEWKYEEQIVEQLSQFSLYAVLMEHRPEVKTRLVRAAIKIRFGRGEAPLGALEFGTVANQYVAEYFPRTSDDAVMQFVYAATAVFDQMLILRPESCIAFLEGDRYAFAGHLPEHVLRRYVDALAGVIKDAIANPQPLPDPSTIERQRQRVAKRLTTDGNPLATDPQRLLGDPHRACFALLAIYGSIAATLPPEEIPAFLRGTVPAFFQDDEA